VRAELRTAQGDVVRTLDDPGGGTFDAAGNFDDVLGSSARHSRLLKYVDPHGPRCDAMFNRHQMDDLLHDIDTAMSRAESPITRRGLDRLRAMATCSRDSDEDNDLYIWFMDPRPSLRDVVTDGLVLGVPLPDSVRDMARISPPPPAADEGP
jgi:hypothetical protein